MASLRDRLRNIEEKVELYLNIKRFDAAEKLLKTSLHDYGDLANLYNLLGTTYQRQSKFEEAISCFRQAAKLNPRFIEASLNLALSYCDLGMYSEASSAYQLAKQEVDSPENPHLSSLLAGRIANLHNQTAKAYEDADLPQQAAVEYKKALSIFPAMPEIYLKLAQIYYYELSDAETSRQFLREYERRFPASVELHAFLGLIAYEEGHLEQAKSHWHKASQIDPKHPLPRSYLRCIAQKNNKF